MGCCTTSHAWIIGAVCSTSGNIMNWYGSNFNMPVPLLFDGSSDETNGFMAARCNNIGSTSHCLSGTWFAGYELAVADYLAVWWADSGTDTDGCGVVQQQWYRPSGAINCNSIPVHVILDSEPGNCTWSWYEIMVNTGIACWEVCDTSTSTHCVVSQVTQLAGSNVCIAACTVSFDLAGVPSTAQTNYQGSIWVEGNNLNYWNANWFEHSIVGTCVSGPLAAGNVGAMWIDGSHDLHWVGADCNNYKVPWKICQFCSSFSNGAPANPAPGAGYAGTIWVDGQFGLTHLSYIGCDGNKYLAGAGKYPYSF